MRCAEPHLVLTESVDDVAEAALSGFGWLRFEMGGWELYPGTAYLPSPPARH